MTSPLPKQEPCDPTITEDNSQLLVGTDAPRVPCAAENSVDQCRGRKRRRARTAQRSTNPALNGRPTVMSAPPPGRVSKVAIMERLLTPQRDALRPLVFETAFQQPVRSGEGVPTQRTKVRRARKKQKPLNGQLDFNDLGAVTVNDEASAHQSVPWDGEEDSLRYDNKGRPWRLRRQPQRLLDELDTRINSAATVEDNRQAVPLPTPNSITSAGTPLSGVEGDPSTPQPHGPQRQRKRAKLRHKLSAPNEHGIVVEESEKAGSAPLSLTKWRRRVRTTCNDKKISKHVLALLGLPTGNSPRSATTDGKSRDEHRLAQPRKTKTDAELPSSNTADDYAASRPITPTEAAEATPKTDDMPPVRVAGVRSSTFASVMRIVSGVCPLQPSPRLARLCRPSVAPPVWAQVSKSGFG